MGEREAGVKLRIGAWETGQSEQAPIESLREVGKWGKLPSGAWEMGAEGGRWQALIGSLRKGQREAGVKPRLGAWGRLEREAGNKPRLGAWERG
jgi:hypothetical protein